jgi:uncharacterized protein (TIGR02266 family)
VSYSVNLSKGGIFIETSQPADVGAQIQLHFEVPGAGAFEVMGQVAWARKGSPDGLPDGMGVQFEQLDDRYGAVIDAMVRDFSGLRVLVVAASPDRLALLGRTLRSIISCEIVEATGPEVAEVALEDAPDLVVIDLENAREMGLRTIRNAKQRTRGELVSTPVILLAKTLEERALGAEAGADEVLATPPSFHDLQVAVIRTLSRPSAVR